MNKRRRLGLTSWLRTQLRDGKFREQLWWANEEEQIFALRWTHASCATYNPLIDSALFHEWAKHTGNAKSTTDDAKTWKATFRCALASVSSLQRINKKPGRKGKPPLLLYKFVQKSAVKRKQRTLRNTESTIPPQLEMTTASNEMFVDENQFNIDSEVMLDDLFEELQFLLNDPTLS